jgi:hypothetical protein
MKTPFSYVSPLLLCCRLANPTNFTKMGLWTLGGQSSNDRGNPIAGMLQKELGITIQQGRKILEQRQKIQDVCSNLKEVCMALYKMRVWLHHFSRN